jgi:hypothetical protein
VEARCRSAGRMSPAQVELIEEWIGGGAQN